MDAILFRIVRQAITLTAIVVAGCGASTQQRRHAGVESQPRADETLRAGPVLRASPTLFDSDAAVVSRLRERQDRPTVRTEHPALATAKTPVAAALSNFDRGVGHETTSATPVAYEVADVPSASDPQTIEPESLVPVDSLLPGGAEILPAGAYTMTLWGVLSIADGQNPNVAAARERINEAYARAERAHFLCLPNLRVGAHYNHHEGNQQNSQGEIVDVSRSSLYGGFGAGAAGSGSPAQPGLFAQFHISDALFQPRIADQIAASRQYGAAAVRNDVLRNTAIAYLELVRAEFSLAIGEEALTNTRNLHDLTSEYATSGQGLQSDFERMQTELALRTANVIDRREAARVTAARLAQLLHADASVPIASGEPTAIPLEILASPMTEAELVATGLSRRPELAEQQHLVCAAVERLHRERYAPLVPTVLLGISYGAQAGGTGGTIDDGDNRFDADAMAFWEVRSLGIGERAARRESSSLVTQEQFRAAALMDQVAREVVEAHVQVERRRERIEITRSAILAAEQSHRLNSERIQNAQGLPIEVLQSIQALATARDAYLDAVIDYNIAQFELCRAIGWFVE